MQRLGFIGSGVMASALIGGLTRTGLFSCDRIIASDPQSHSKERLTQMGVMHTDDNTKVVEDSNIIIIAVKPNVLVSVLNDITKRMDPDILKTKSFISIAAGVSIQTIENCIPNAKSVIRVMPNTPCLVGECAAAYAVGTKTTADDSLTCETIFNAVGSISQVSEKLMDAVTGLSGSGPACTHIQCDCSRAYSIFLCL
jgi:pyrroline-5-carboxylate reductase